MGRPTRSDCRPHAGPIRPNRPTTRSSTTCRTARRKARSPASLDMDETLDVGGSPLGPYRGSACVFGAATVRTSIRPSARFLTASASSRAPPRTTPSTWMPTASGSRRSGDRSQSPARRGGYGQPDVGQQPGAGGYADPTSGDFHIHGAVLQRRMILPPSSPPRISVHAHWILPGIPRRPSRSNGLELYLENSVSRKTAVRNAPHFGRRPLRARP